MQTALLNPPTPNGPIPANERRVRTGGLMRCCTQTLCDSTEPSNVLDRLNCQYCSGVMMVARDGVWEWDQAESYKRYGIDLQKAGRSPGEL